MRRGRLLAEGVHIACLGIWAGSLAMIAAGAPLVFNTLKPMEPLLADYLAYREPHYRIAGGHIVQRLFAVCDMVQASMALIAGLALIWVAIGRRGATLLALLRVVLLLATVGILGYRFNLLDPKLAAQLDAYWQAAAAGNTLVAEELRAVYDRGHAFERKLFAATALLVLTMLWLALVSLRRVHCGPDGESGKGGQDVGAAAA